MCLLCGPIANIRLRWQIITQLVVGVKHVMVGLYWDMQQRCALPGAATGRSYRHERYTRVSHELDTLAARQLVSSAVRQLGSSAARQLGKL
jgi:hypothetical protein